ncbi:hypothetical protein A4A49_25510 [Nicotiana attenuata]|uniref:Uncharacterized protein n=1 Tax=Nicotiana attenuata TaxID=49451 RepID=A0A1J6IC84_NICAT|nr:hypothetical protein A4A49_25510 [Nicotiana attenuata]
MAESGGGLNQLEQQIQAFMERSNRKLEHTEEWYQNRFRTFHSLENQYNLQSGFAKPTNGGWNYLDSSTSAYYYQIPCAYQIDNTNPGFRFVQFGDGSVMSMTGAGLENLLNSGYGYFENKMPKVDYPCVEPPFILTKAEAGTIEDERVAFLEIESDSSVKKMEYWVKEVPMEIEGENADKVFAEIFNDLESPPIVSKSIPDLDVLKPSDGDEDTPRENVVKLEYVNKTSDIPYSDAFVEDKVEYEEHSENKEGKMFDEYPQWDVAGCPDALSSEKKDAKKSYVKIVSQGLEHDVPVTFDEKSRELLALSKASVSETMEIAVCLMNFACSFGHFLASNIGLKSNGVGDLNSYNGHLEAKHFVLGSQMSRDDYQYLNPSFLDSGKHEDSVDWDKDSSMEVENEKGTVGKEAGMMFDVGHEKNWKTPTYDSCSPYEDKEGSKSNGGMVVDTVNFVELGKYFPPIVASEKEENSEKDAD